MAAESEMEELREQLFNVEVTDDNLLKRLIQISRNRARSLNEVADEWISFSSSKSLQLDYENIETFSSWLSSRQQKPQSSLQTTPTSTQRYTKDNLHLLFNSGGRAIHVADDNEENVMSTYQMEGEEGVAKVGGVKREAPPSPMISPAPKNRYSSSRTPVRNEEPSHYQMLDTPTTNYRSSQTSGKVIASFSQGAEKWVESKGIGDIRYRNTAGTKMKRLMYQPPLHKRSVMAQRIISFGEKICHQIGIKDISSTALLTGPTTEPSVFIGRIVCDSEGRLNAHSCLLEGVWSYEVDVLKTRLVRVMLDLSKSLEQLSICLFPGQIIAVEGTLNHSGVLMPTKIHDSGALPPLPSVRNPLGHKFSVGSGGLSCISAAGPFTLMESLDLSPLYDLLTVVDIQKPKLLILVGPFIEHTHVSVKNGKDFENYDSFETYFVTEILQPIHATCSKSNTRVLIIPAQNDVCHSLMIYPQQPYQLPDAISNEVSNVISLLPDPYTLNIDGINIGISSVDILFHLSSSSLSIGTNHGDRMARLLSHILQQQCYYPLYPPYLREDTVTKATSTAQSTGNYLENLPEVNIDLQLAYGDSEAPGQACLNVLPDVLILPSKLKPFIKNINGCLCINPGHFARKGTYSKLTAAVSTPAGKEVDKSAQIIHI